MHRERPCDCDACWAVRLAAFILLAGLAALLLVALLVRPGEPKPLLIDATPAAVRICIEPPAAQPARRPAPRLDTRSIA